MEYLQFNDELTNSIHTKRHHDYWDFYLDTFEDQIQNYVDDFEWDKAKGACAELVDIANRFPKKWWTLEARYRLLATNCRKDVEQLYNLEFNEIETYE